MANANTKRAHSKGKKCAPQGRTLGGSGSREQSYVTRNVGDIVTGTKVDSGALREAHGKQPWLKGHKG